MSTPAKGPRRRRGPSLFTNVIVAIPAVAGAVALAWAYLGPLPPNPNEAAFLVKGGQRLPALEVAGPAGEAGALAALLPAGAPGVVMVMAPDCEHCHTQLSVLSQLRAEEPALVPRVVLVSVGEEEPTAQFRARYPGWPVYLDTRLALQRQYDLRSVPALLLVDRRGVLREVRVGLQPRDRLKPLLESLREGA